MSAKNKQSTGLTFLILSAACLVGMFAEYLVLECEQFIYNKNYFQFTITESICHWVFICFIWGMVGAVLFYVADRVYNFNAVHSNEKPTRFGWTVAIILLAAAIVSKYFVLNGWKIWIEFHRSGWFQFSFQCVYYLFEVFMVMLTVVFAQEAGKRIFKLDKVPWGGIVLAVTWGVSHIFTQANVVIGMFYVLYSLLFGIAYLSVRKNIYIAYALGVFMFLL